jgi:hypothetical protein
MRTDRRKFPLDAQLGIVKRATDGSGRIHCEGCSVWVKSRRDYEIDHIISEGVRPPADKGRRLTAADGQLLCTAVCHPAKTRRDDAAIAQAKRREASSLGLERPGKVKIGRREKREPERLPNRVANGVPALARRGFVPAGKP